MNKFFHVSMIVFGLGLSPTATLADEAMPAMDISNDSGDDIEIQVINDGEIVLPKTFLGPGESQQVHIKKTRRTFLEISDPRVQEARLKPVIPQGMNSELVAKEVKEGITFAFARNVDIYVSYRAPDPWEEPSEWLKPQRAANWGRWIGFGKTKDGFPTSKNLSQQEIDEHRYIINGRKTGEQTVTDMLTGLEWQREPESGKTWSEAKAYCASLDLQGARDWRLPEMNELGSLLVWGNKQGQRRCGAGPYCMNRDAFPNSKKPEPRDFFEVYMWSANAHEPDSYGREHARNLNFLWGSATHASIENHHSVRCVRNVNTADTPNLPRLSPAE